MYDDELKALKENLDKEHMMLSQDNALHRDELAKKRMLIIKKLCLIKKGILEAEKNRRIYASISDVNLVRDYKKAIKHEFLTQAKEGYTLESILHFLRENYDNPGINLEKFISKLRYHVRTGKGYFLYDERTEEGTPIYLLRKAYRYLENEANVSLKK